ncbi:uncharacterized protein ACNLHF_003688 [Anomaloglossus baeobatrachus]
MSEALSNSQLELYTDAAEATGFPVVGYLRHLVLRCLELNICVVARHVPGVRNEVADALSRFQFCRFRTLVPGADADGEPCPEWLWGLASV